MYWLFKIKDLLHDLEEHNETRGSENALLLERL